MKVVQINLASFGSTGTIAKSIHYALLAQGEESYIFYGSGTSNEDLIQPVGSAFENKWHNRFSYYLGRQGYLSVRGTKRLLKKLDMISPDVVHLHNLHGSYVNLPLLFRYLKTSQIKTVITLHDCWLFTGKCPYFSLVQCDKWKENCGNCPQLATYPASRIDTTRSCLRDKKRWLKGFRDLTIVSVSNWLKEIAEESFLADYPITTIHNGIDDSVFCPRHDHTVREKYGLVDKFIILGVSSPWSERKGLRDFYQLAEKIGENDVIFLVGLTEEQIAALPANVIGITRTDSKETLAQLYAAADVFVNMSREESFGMVTAEAMACGTPVIVYNATACAEIVDTGTGYVAQPGNVDEVFKYVEQEKQCPTKSAVRKVYRNADMVQNYLNLYKNIEK